MDKRYNDSLTAEERRRKNRRFNAILYTIGAVLVLAGIIIIINDQTFLFDKIGKWFSGEKSDMPTFPPFASLSSADPNYQGTYPPYWSNEPGTTPPPWAYSTPEPGSTAGPGNTGGSSGSHGGSWTAPTPLPEAGPEAPVYVYFPQYDISCPVDPVGYNWRGQMDVIRAYNRAGWLITSGTPVTGGNILIAGHNRYSGKLGYFSVIKDKLQVGDQVIVKMKSGDFAYYIVESVNKWRYDQIPDHIMRLDSIPRLTLITCFGDYSSSVGSSIHRVIAVCRPVIFNSGEPDETAEPIVTDEPMDTLTPIDGTPKPFDTLPPGETE